jgi:hypothetical protein
MPAWAGQRREGGVWEEREEEENRVIRVESVQNKFPAKQQKGQNKLECQSALVCARSSTSSGSSKVDVIL